MVDSTMEACGVASFYLRPSAFFPKIPIVNSAKKWQKTFFYVKNADPAVDKLNLPPFGNTVPSAKPHWGHDPKKGNSEILDFVARLKVLEDTCHLVVTDFLAAFMSRRVLRLQSRSHKMGHMCRRTWSFCCWNRGVSRTQDIEY